jgi:multimeric flavodoxin WrbA
MKNLAIVYHSGYGHTAFAAQRVLEGAATVDGIQATLVAVGGENVTPWEELKNADAIIFGTPTYMGSVSGQFKTFMDESSKVWMGREWKDKVAAGFTVSGSPSGDKQSTLQALTTFALQHGMVWVGYDRMPEVYSGVAPEQARNRLGSFSGLMLQAAQKAPEESFLPGDLASASDFGQRVATVLANKIR